MLTAANVSSEMAVNYFIKNYYHQGKSRWSGKGAEKLGLSGAVENQQVFKNVISGLSPNGLSQLNARVLKPSERRAALDCTFSAPKSVSLMGLVGGDSRLIAAHHQALEKVLTLMEHRYAITRVTQGDSRHRVNTGNLVVAQFDHIESRSLDPHLHTHCLVMNTTQADSKWMSLVNSEIFANKKFLGMAYQNYLAAEVIKLGYEVEPRQHGQFEIKGFKSQDLEAFSKRRQQIIALAGASSSWAEREKVWDKTRQRKQKISQEELQTLWKQEAHSLGISFVKPSEPKPEVDTHPANQENISQILSEAIAHCSERNVAFKFEDIAKFILSERLATDVTQIEPHLKQHPQILVLPGLETQYTTVAAVSREIATIELMEQGLQKVNPISQREVIENQLEKTLLNQGQRQAVAMALTTCDQFVAWQGVAGAGKTFALKELNAIATDRGYTIKAFAPSSMAAKVLNEELGIQGETVASLLVSKAPQQPEQNQIWIVDEAGLLSAKDAYALLERARREGARLLLVGDTKQLGAVEAGNPFKSLQQAGIQTVHLTQSNRQRNPELKIAVDLIADGKVEAGFKQLEAIGSIKEVSKEAKLEMIASDYMALSKEQRQRTLVLAGTNLEKLALTQVIRDKLKVEGSLGATANITQLKTKDLTLVQMRYTHNFELGDVIMPTRNYKRRGLEKGKLYEVVSKDLDRLTLKTEAGSHLEVDTNFDKAVYQRNEIEIAVGDRLQWKKNDRHQYRRNGQEFVVTAINGDTASIKYKDGERSEIINLKVAQNLDYALVSTTYSSQGKTAERALISADYTIGQESFYVAVSRAKDHIKLFTEDKQYLLELAQKSKAKDNALELLRKQVKQQLASSRSQIEIIIEEPVVSTVAPPVLKTQSVEKPVVKSTVAPPVLKTESTGVIKTLQQQPTAVTTSKPIPKQPASSSTALQKPILKKRIPEEAFWTPKKSEPAPNHIDLEHWQELVVKSAIHPDIAALNFESLHFSYAGGEHEAWGRLMISPQLSRTNTGSLSNRWLKTYSNLDAGGWWCSGGIDPRTFASLTPGAKAPKKEWGCYKPNQPREQPHKKESKKSFFKFLENSNQPCQPLLEVDQPKKLVKYEHPPKIELSIFLLDVPPEIAERIYAKHEVNPTDSDRAIGFWYCVWKYNLPITITEGAKKAASLLSQGHVAIGLPGISAGYRSPKDEFGNKIGKSYLAEELAVFATKGREIKFCFDYETKPETIVNIKRDISTTGWLLQKQGAVVKVITLPGPEKGVDDFIVTQGPLAYEKVSHEAVSLRDWQQSCKQQQRAGAIEPPRKLTPEIREQRLASKSTSQPTQTKEPDHDDHQQQKQPATIRDHITNREDRPIVEQPLKIEHQNRATRGAQPTVEPENRAVVNEANREHQRLENQSLELLAAISRYFEQQAILELEADLRELNRSFTSGELRGQRRSNIPADAHQLDSASPDSPTSDVSFKSNANERVINVISNFLEIEEIASVIDVEGLQTKIRDLRPQEQPHAKANAPEQVQKTYCAITNFVEQKQVSSVLVKALPSLTQQLYQYKEQLKGENKQVKNLQQSLKEESATTKACEAITQHAQLEAVSSSKVVQTLESVVEELRQLPETMLLLKEVVASEKSQISLNAIASYIEQESIEQAVIEVLPSITKELLLYQEQLVDENRSLQNLDQRPKEQLATTQALEAIALNIEQSNVEVALTETLPLLLEQLSQYQQQHKAVITAFDDLGTAIDHLEELQSSQRTVDVIANLISQSVVDDALAETLPQLTEQISQYQQQLLRAKTAFNDLETAVTAELQSHAEKRGILLISDYVEQSAIDSAFSQTVLGLTEQLSQYKEQLVEAKTTFNDFEEVLTAELQSHAEKRAILLTSNSVEQSTTESTLAETLLAELKLHLKQMIQSLDNEKLALLVTEVGKYIKGEFVTGEKVNDLFTSVTTDALALTFEQKMNIVRQLIRDDKPSIMERLRINSPLPDDNGEQIRFRR